MFVREFPWTAYSGHLGPKLRQGDLQIPEGLYRINALNANSKFHLSLRINYPNMFDQHYAQLEARTKPGNNIFIHGKRASIGCIAIGDQGIEDIFVLVVDVGFDKVNVILTPVDFRQSTLKMNGPSPAWLPELYRSIKESLVVFSDKPS